MPNIMIIEDDPAVREELALLLQNEGYRPDPVADFADVQQDQVGPPPAGPT